MNVCYKRKQAINTVGLTDTLLL